MVFENEYTVENFTEGALREAKGDRKNVVVGMGFLGNIMLCLNPESVQEVLDHYEQHFDEKAEITERVMTVGFNKRIEVYDFSQSEPDE